MTTIKGTWTNGGIVLDEPEGCRVIIEPTPEAESIGVREEDWDESPEAVADWLRWYTTR